MSTRLLLEGDDLEQLLTRVRAEYGPDATVVRAERVRTGGIAGFFARERFELTIEVPERGPLGGWARSGRGALGGQRSRPEATGIDALLDAADAAERGEQPLALPAPVPAGPQLSTGRDTFASVLDSVRSMAGAVPLEGVVEPAVPPVPQVPDATASGSPADAVPTVPGTAALPGTSALPGAPEPPSNAPAPGGAFAPITAPTVPVTSSSVVLRPPGAGTADLLALGVPARLMGEAVPGPVPLSDLLRAVPNPPLLARIPGSLIAVVGDTATVLATARQMASRLGLQETDVVLAGDLEAIPGFGRRVQTAAAARRFRDRATADDGVMVVAIGVGSEPADVDRGAEVLEALAPDQVWAVVDARSKPRDCVRWLVDVGRGRRVDALAVANVFATEQPGTVLDLGVPVGWVDGLPATRVTWAAVLSRRLGDDARWD
jgi:hypothetical protein